MRADIASNEPTSARTSAEASADATPPALYAEVRGSSEGAYLETEAACTHVSIRKAFDRLRHHVADVADPHELVRKHPWASLGAAVSVGFVAAATVVPRKGESASDKWARVRSHLPETKNSETNEQQESGSAIKAAIATFVMTNLMEIGRLLVEKIVHPEQDDNEVEHSHEPEHDARYGPEEGFSS